MNLDLFVDLQARRLVDGLNSAANAILPGFKQGDTVDVIVHGLERNPDRAGNLYVEVPITWNTMKLGMGPIDAPPRAGGFRVAVVGDGVTTEDGEGNPLNLSEVLDYNVTDEALAIALNQIPAVQTLGGLVVLQSAEDAPNLWVLQWTDPAVTATFEFREVRVAPKCFGRVTAWPTDVGTQHILKIFQAPFAFTDQFQLPQPPAPVADIFVAGTGTRNQVVRIRAARDARGDIALSFAGLTTSVLSIGALSIATISAALNGLYADGATRFVVTNPREREWHAEYVGPLAASEQPGIDVVAIAIPPLDTPTASLPLTSPAIELLLSGAASAKSRMELVIADDGGRETTLFQVDVRIDNDMLDAPMALDVPGWLEQPPPDIGGGGDPIIKGGISAEAIFGDGTTGPYPFTHNLGETDLHVTVWQVESPFERIPDDQYTVVIENNNKLVLKDFAENVGADSLKVIATTVGTTLYPHTHPISEINGLQDILDGLSAAGNPLELWPSVTQSKIPKLPWSLLGWDLVGTAYVRRVIPDELLPANIPRLTNGTLDLSVIPPEVPRIDANGNLIYYTRDADGNLVTHILVGADGRLNAETLPPLNQIPGFQDAVLEAIGAGSPPAGVTVMELPVTPEVLFYKGQVTYSASGAPEGLPYRERPYLLPAIHTDAEPTPLPDPLPDDPTTVATPTLYVNDGAEDVDIFPGGRVSKTTAAPGDFVACDRRSLYGVRRDGETNSFFPIAFERRLFQLSVSANMLYAGRTFLCEFGVGVQAIDANTMASWVLEIQIGKALSGLTPSPTSPNLQNISWVAEPILRQQLDVGPIYTVHPFGIRVEHGEEEITLTSAAYGMWSPGTPPDSAAFVLRARLINFDIEDDAIKPRGHIFYRLVGTDNKPARAVIF